MLLDVAEIMRPVLKLENTRIEGEIESWEKTFDIYEYEYDVPYYYEDSILIDVYVYFDLLHSFTWKIDNDFRFFGVEKKKKRLIDETGAKLEEYSQNNPDYYEYQEWVILFILWKIAREKAPLDLSPIERTAMKFNEELISNLFFEL